MNNHELLATIRNRD